MGGIGEACISCKFYHRETCRRFPPDIVVQGFIASAEIMTVYPPTDPTGWCGEFRRAEVITERTDP